MKIRIAFFAALVLTLTGCQPPGAGNGGISLITKVHRTPWNSEHSAGELLTTDHYKLYTTSRNSTVTNYLPGFLEAAHENYLKLTGLPDRPDDPPHVVYMMGSREEWVILTKNVLHAHRDLYLSIEAGGYCYQGVCVFWDLRGHGTFSVAAHEGLHQFLHRRMRNHLPMWVEEGLCVSAEAHEISGQTARFHPEHNPFRFSSLRKAFLQGHWMPLRKLLPLDGGDVATKPTEQAVGYYAQLWALSMFMRSQPAYSEGLNRMIADAQEGRFRQVLKIPPNVWRTLRGRVYNRTVAEPLFRHYITTDLDSFDREYGDFARRFAELK